MSEKRGPTHDFLIDSEICDSELLAHVRQSHQAAILEIFGQLYPPAERRPDRGDLTAYRRRRETLDGIRKDLNPMLIAKAGLISNLLDGSWADWKSFRRLSDYEYHTLAAIFHAAGVLFWQNEIRHSQEAEQNQEPLIAYQEVKRQENEARAFYHSAVCNADGQLKRQITAEFKENERPRKIVAKRVEEAAERWADDQSEPLLRIRVRSLTLNWQMTMDTEYPPLRPSLLQ